MQSVDLNARHQVAIIRLVGPNCKIFWQLQSVSIAMSITMDGQDVMMALAKQRQNSNLVWEMHALLLGATRLCTKSTLQVNCTPS